MKAKPFRSSERGTFRWKCRGPLLYTSWCDTRVVNFLTTRNVPYYSDIAVDRRSSTGAKISVDCPPCMLEYQCNMRDVDLADRLRTTYDTKIASKKWWHVVFFWGLDSASSNSLAIWKLTVDPECEALTFRRMLVNDLVKAYKKHRPRRTSLHVKRNVAEVKVHKMVWVGESLEGKQKRHKCLRCAYCHSQEKETGSRHKCDICDKGFCPSCFHQWPQHSDIPA